MPQPKVETLISGLLRGDRRSLSQLITLVENDAGAARRAIRILYPRTGRAAVVGVTGIPGCGKSTLISALTREIRKAGKTVGIVAVDPTSMFSGGAFLGDRVRMRELTEDPSVFIRSMATRGSLGGLARATADVVRVLDASSKDYIIIETAGAGQSDIEIVKLSGTTVVVTAPDMGDEIQAFKAGLMEIADIFVVNKADRPGADKTVLELEAMLRTRTDWGKWRPMVLRTVATRDTGIKQLMEKVQEHQKLLEAGGGARTRESQAEAQLREALRTEFELKILPAWARSSKFETLVEKVASRRLDPYSGAKQFLRSARLPSEIRARKRIHQ